MKIVSVVGARPQFIKSAPVSLAIADAGHEEYLVHTGQHYDYEMSDIFFDEMGINKPSINLNVRARSHAQQTSQMMVGIEAVLLTHKPDIVLVYGDTNSTLAGALAAVKLQIKLAHIEAGLRSFNREMPEEHNRVLTDHCSELLFCPTQTAVDNLVHEGIHKGVHLVGDTMYDAALQFGGIATQRSKILLKLGLIPKGYLLVTIHRPYNTDKPDVLTAIMSSFHRVDETIVFPIHPRTLQTINAEHINIPPNVNAIEPVGYLDMLMLEQNARLIVTDSGGIQKEAYFFSVPCITLRPETEWVETTNSGWNVIVGTDTERILTAIRTHKSPKLPPSQLFGDGHSSEIIVNLLSS
jgi:UDP-N-acetylglucosamine 2-epimerase